MRWPARVIRNQCIVEFVLHRRRLERPGGYVLAATHLGHLEPALIACHTARPIHWIARREFYRHRLAAAALRWCGAMPIDRRGRSVRTMRRAIALASAGEVVGIFPEGGVTHGAAALIRGGEPKLGACVIAIRAGVPIVPAVLLGVDRLHAIGPWLPAKRGRVWVAYGRTVEPPPASMPRRLARFEMGERMRAEFARLYDELRDRGGVDDGEVP